MKYRSDIDGLRAIAVVPVILSHAGFSTFAGGFVGVDVFFVISGFLITRILLGEMEAGTYSLRGFYERRARRILPALLVVLVATYPFAWELMLPDFLQNFGQSVVATLLFANNLLLAKTSGYWELESNFKPLLHTWSLGVEEQFYIVFPLLLSAVWRFGHRWQLALIGCLGIGSLALAEYGWRTNPAVSFYLPTTRAWELMAGCAAAYVERKERATDNVFSFAGLFAIFFAILFYEEHTPSPSIYTALPVVGTTVVLLYSRPGTIACRLLSLPPLVGIGLISYSAYLWHQPVFALTRVALLDAPGLPLMGALSVISLGLAWLSWRFVERPFRSAQTIPLQHFALPVTVLTASLVASGLYLHVQQGLPKRIFPNIEGNGDVYISYNERIGRYQANSFPQNHLLNVLVIGNSFGRDAANVLIESGALAQSNLVYLKGGAEHFEEGNAPPEAANLLKYADVIIVAIQGGEPQDLVTGIGRIIESTPGVVLVIGPKQFGNNLNPFGRLSMSERGQARSKVSRQVVALNESLRELLPHTRYIDLLALLGDDGKTVAVFDANGNPLSPDRIHLTKYGAKFIADRLRKERPEVLRLFQAAPSRGD